VGKNFFRGVPFCGWIAEWALWGFFSKRLFGARKAGWQLEVLFDWRGIGLVGLDFGWFWGVFFIFSGIFLAARKAGGWVLGGFFCGLPSYAASTDKTRRMIRLAIGLLSGLCGFVLSKRLFWGRKAGW